MSEKQIHILAFDVYGTLYNTDSIANDIEKHLSITSDKAKEVSLLWRRYQLEYTWRMNSMKIYESFDVVTRNSLVHTLKELQLSFTEAQILPVMESYNILPCFPDVINALRQLSGLENVKIVIFSNGTRTMIERALHGAGISTFAQDIVVADSFKCFKPDPAVYKGLLSSVNHGNEVTSDHCWLVSGNPFDITGALSCGLGAIWVDRLHKGWSDALYGTGPTAKQPTKIVNNLEEIVKFFEGLL